MSRIDTLEPDFQPKIQQLLDALNASTGIKWGVVQGRRTIAYQNELYAQGRTKPGQVVTKAKGGQSPHNFGLAADLCPMKDNDFWWNCPQKYWNMLGEIAEGMGLVWGGHFHSIIDYPHVEDLHWKDAQAKWKAGKLEIE